MNNRLSGHGPAIMKNSGRRIGTIAHALVYALPFRIFIVGVAWRLPSGVLCMADKDP